MGSNNIFLWLVPGVKCDQIYYSEIFSLERFFFLLRELIMVVKIISNMPSAKRSPPTNPNISSKGDLKEGLASK